MPADPVVVATNEFPNPTGAGGTSYVSTANATTAVTPDPAQSFDAAGSFKVAHVSGVPDARFQLSATGFAVPAGQTRTFRARIMFPSSNVSAFDRVRAILRDDTTGTSYSTSPPIDPTGPFTEDEWTEYALTHTVPEGRTLTRVYWRADVIGARDPADVCYFDALQSHDGPYFDGDTPAAGGFEYEWTGTPHASASRKLTASPWPDDLREALIRRVARNLAMGALPLGVQATEVGGMVLGGKDPEVRRLEAPWRKVVMG